jgi:hypothetical protein
MLFNKKIKKGDATSNTLFFAIILIISGILLIPIFTLFGSSIKILLGFPNQDALNNFDRLKITINSKSEIEDKTWLNTLPKDYIIFFMSENKKILTGDPYIMINTNKEDKQVRITCPNFNARNKQDPTICLATITYEENTNNLKINSVKKCEKINKKPKDIMFIEPNFDKKSLPYILKTTKDNEFYMKFIHLNNNK